MSCMLDLRRVLHPAPEGNGCIKTHLKSHAARRFVKKERDAGMRSAYFIITSLLAGRVRMYAYGVVINCRLASGYHAVLWHAVAYPRPRYHAISHGPCTRECCVSRVCGARARVYIAVHCALVRAWTVRRTLVLVLWRHAG